MVAASRFPTALAAILCSLVLVASLASVGERLLPRASAEPRSGNPAALASHYDVLVVGASPEGVATAVSAARAGVSVLLVDTAPEPGGLITRGWLNQFDLNSLPSGAPAIRGFFAELQARLGGEASFDVRLAREVFWRYLETEPGLTFALGLDSITPRVLGRSVEGARLGFTARLARGELRRGEVTVSAERTIDATPDADFAAAAGASFTVGRESLGLDRRAMAATLMFRLSGVDWGAVRGYLEQDGNPLSGSTPRAAWGFAEYTRRYQPPLGLRLRGLNLGRQSDGTVIVNGLLMLGVDALDKQSILAARTKAKRALPGILQFLREQLPGFRNAALEDVAPELYLRESRHLKSLYVLTIDDLLEHRDFPDKIALASYPVDLQPYDADRGQVVGNPLVYSVPFRSLIPRELDDLLVVGRSAGYDALAQGSARVIPVGIAEGQAAGTAAALSLRLGLTFPALAAADRAMADLQEELTRQGAFLAQVASLLPPAVLTQEEALRRDPVYPALAFMRRLGLTSGGYTNDYRLDSPLAAEEVAALYSEAATRHQGDNPPSWQPPDRSLTRREAYSAIFATLTAGS